MRTPLNLDELEIYVWEGSADIAERVERCMASLDVQVMRADGVVFSAVQDISNTAIAVISVSVLEGAQLTQQSIEGSYGMPVIWVAASGREREKKSGFAAEYSHVLPYDFTGAELRAMVVRVVQQMRANTVRQVQTNDLIAIDACMIELLKEVDVYADCEHNVLIYGETGVGKERVAQRLHEKHTGYCQGPFVVVNCGAIPDGLFESLFFGHAKGAFTGAVAAHKGYFEQANGGTLFLDELESMPMGMQIKLLRVLQERQIERVGSNQPIAVDVRIVAATKDDLLERARRGNFRADLYYRLNVVTLHLPALRERREDVPLLLEHFLLLAASRFSRPLPHICDQTLRELMAHDWPGNVRELRLSLIHI